MLSRKAIGRPNAASVEAAKIQADRIAALSQILDVLPDAAAIVDESSSQR